MGFYERFSVKNLAREMVNSKQDCVHALVSFMIQGHYIYKQHYLRLRRFKLRSIQHY